jgi:hypothetical protein
MQKFLASVAALAALSALAALCGCATDPAAQTAQLVEKEYVTGSRLPQRDGSRVDKSKMTEADREEYRRLSETATESARRN